MKIYALSRIKYTILVLVACILASSCDPEAHLIPLIDEEVASAPYLDTECPNYLYQNKKDMVFIEASEFDMFGTKDTPYVSVHVDSFYIDIKEVTQGEFDYFVLTTDYEPDQKLADGQFRVANYSRKPAVVSARDAKAYAEWVGKRLPTEIEWEKAARGGIHRARFPWGDELPTVGENFDNSSVRLFHGSNFRFCNEAAIYFLPATQGAISDKEFVSEVTYPKFKAKIFYQNVQRYAPNDYGLFDMIGGANELTADTWNKNGPLLIAAGITDWVCDKKFEGEGGTIIIEQECVHVIKGGGFVHSELEARNRDRAEYTIHIGERTYGRWGGFRLAMDY